MSKRPYTCTIIADIDATSPEEAAHMHLLQVRSEEPCVVSVRDCSGNSDDVTIEPKSSDFIVAACNPDTLEWTVSARASIESDWSTFEGAEDELDTLMSLARDVATGG